MTTETNYLESSKELLGLMLNNTRSALSFFTESRRYGTAIHVSPAELLDVLRENVLTGVKEASKKYGDENLGLRLYQSFFQTEYTFPNKHAFKLITQVLAESELIVPVMTSHVTLEGEGPEIGKATILTRLGGCAVRCKGCDTPHSWNANSNPVKAVEGSELDVENYGLMHVADLTRLILNQAEASGVNRVSITGGEPLHYISALRLLVAELWLHGLYVNLETSGVLFDPIIFAMTHTSIDIKTPSANVSLVPSQIGALHAMASYRNPNPAHLKAVIGTQEDLEFILDHFGDVLNGYAVYRPICFTPFGPVNDADVDLSSLGTTVDMICEWMFTTRKSELDSRQIRVVNQQHKVFGIK